MQVKAWLVSTFAPEAFAPKRQKVTKQQAFKVKDCLSLPKEEFFKKFTDIPINCDSLYDCDAVITVLQCEYNTMSFNVALAGGSF